MIVVDASVAMKWYVPEDGLVDAFGLLRCGRKLVGPSVIRHEVTSGLVRRVRREEITSGEAMEAVSDWLVELERQTVHLVEEDNELLQRAASIGCDLGHPLFDCIYLALSERLQAPLVTTDTTLIKRARDTFDVHHLADIESMVAA